MLDDIRVHHQRQPQLRLHCGLTCTKRNSSRGPMCSPDVLRRTRRYRKVPFSSLGCAAHKGTNGIVSVKHVLKRFPGQGPERSVSCRTDWNPHGSKDICKGFVEVNQTPRLEYKVSSIFLVSPRWNPWKKQKPMGFSTDGFLPSSALLWLSELWLKLEPQNFGRLSFPQNVQFHQIQNVLQNWSCLAKIRLWKKTRNIFSLSFQYIKWGFLMSQLKENAFF